MIDSLKARPRTRQNNSGNARTETRSGSTLFGGAPEEFFDWEFHTKMKFAGSKLEDRPRTASQIVEGLRDGALKVAQAIGVENLQKKKGIDRLIRKIKKMVFPYLKDEARRMYQLGHIPGQLSRAPFETMREYSDRRAKWYKTLQQMDPDAFISDTARADLLLKYAGLSTEQKLIVRAYVDQDMKYRSLHEGERAPETGSTKKKKEKDKPKDKPGDEGERPSFGIFGKGKGKSTDDPVDDDDSDEDTDSSDDNEVTVLTEYEAITEAMVRLFPDIQEKNMKQLVDRGNRRRGGYQRRPTGFRRRANVHTETAEDWDDYNYDSPAYHDPDYAQAHVAVPEEEELAGTDPWQEDEYGQVAYVADGDDAEEEDEEQEETDISDGEIACEVLYSFTASVGPVELNDEENLEAVALVCQDEQQAYFARRQNRQKFKGRGKGKKKKKGAKGKSKGSVHAFFAKSGRPYKPKGVAREVINTSARKEKLKEIKKRTKCKACGQKGHWQGDPECPMNKNKSKSSHMAMTVSSNSAFVGSESAAYSVSSSEDSADLDKAEAIADPQMGVLCSKSDQAVAEDGGDLQTGTDEIRRVSVFLSLHDDSDNESVAMVASGRVTKTSLKSSRSASRERKGTDDVEVTGERIQIDSDDSFEAVQTPSTVSFAQAERGR